MDKCFLDGRYFSSHLKYCSGYLDNPNGGRYVVLPYIQVSSVKKGELPDILSKIVAFDAAEVGFANLGKINAIPVSSFVGLNGRLAGLDFLSGRENFICKFGDVDVYSLDPFLDVTFSILGTVEYPAYPLFPGSMVPCALKCFYSDDVGREVYSALSISVPKDRSKNPILLMEDAGFVEGDFFVYLKKIFDASVRVCDAQDIEVERIYVSWRKKKVEEGEIACALVMCPYVHLALGLKEKILGEPNGS